MSKTSTASESLSQNVELDEYGCLSLAEIIKCHNAPISEEHAWALIYQCLRALDNCIRDNLIRQPSNIELAINQSQSNDDRPLADVQQHQILSVLTNEEILIQEDGIIHHNTWCSCNNHNSYRPRPKHNYKNRRKGVNRPAVFSEDKAISQFGVVIYSALDAGIGHDKERHLSSGLEEIIENMALSSGDDEGIESDQYDTETEESLTLDHRKRYPSQTEPNHTSNDVENKIVKRRFCPSNACTKFLKLCTSQLPAGSDANIHFRAVCRSLVSEALELSSFMTKVSKLETECDNELMNEIALQDWRRNFRQILGDLCDRSKLKHVDYTKTSTEYELTPYEMLMEDIRRRKYQLNKVETNNTVRKAIPQTAGDVILHFIRSRPTLKPVSQRSLRPQRKESTPAEMLMDSIRGCSARTSLRKTKGPPVKSLRVLLGYETSRCKEDEFENEENNKDDRRKVTLDPSLVQNMLNFSDDESDDETTSPRYSRQASRDSTSKDEESLLDYARRKQGQSVQSPKRYLAPQKSLTRTGVNYSKMAELLVDENDGRVSPIGTDANMYIDEAPASNDRRRHSLTVCETPTRNRRNSGSILDDVDTKQQHNRDQRIILSTQMSNMSMSATSATSTSSICSSRSATPVESILSEQQNDEVNYDLNTPQMHANLHSEFLQSEGWAAALQTLELTLDEVVHIRSVLTKAELENLPLEGTLKEDVEKGKVCFLCMKTSFGFLRRGYQCELCKQRICVKCCTKMNIPTDHFAKTPVISLEDSKTDKQESGTNSPMSHKHMCTISNLQSDENCLQESKSFDPSLNVKQSQNMTSSLINLTQSMGQYEYENSSSLSSLNEPNTYSAEKPTEIHSKRTSHMNRRDQLDGAISDRLEGEPLTVCVDCKEMILQVIRAQSTARRIKMAKSLFNDGMQDVPLTNMSLQNSDMFVNSDVWGEEFY